MSIRNDMISSWFLPESFYRKETGLAYPEQAEFICPQAFGRNTYSDKRVGDIIGAMLESINDPVRRFEWLKERDFDPGRPNRLIALRCIELSRTTQVIEFTSAGMRPLPKPIIGQWEVLYSIWLYEPDWYAKHQNSFIPIWPPVGKTKWSTRDMMLTAFEITEVHGLRIPLIIAHPEHIQRCFFIARKIFGATATDTHDPSEEWYDHRSLQWQTRGPSLWLAYEMLARIHHRFHGWI